MTEEEFENLTVKEIAEICKKSISCYECPFSNTNTYAVQCCLFIDEPEVWGIAYAERNKEGH